jgi:hypothetical protein
VTIKLLPSQIPQLWDAIKYAAVHVNAIPEKDIPLYLNRLLASLLNDKAQCFVRMSNERELQAIAVTRFIKDEVTGDKSLFWECIYSFQLVQNGQWQTDWELISKFAKDNGCKKVIIYTNNHRIIDIVSAQGLSERFRCFMAEV